MSKSANKRRRQKAAEKMAKNEIREATVEAAEEEIKEASETAATETAEAVNNVAGYRVVSEPEVTQSGDTKAETPSEPEAKPVEETPKAEPKQTAEAEAAARAEAEAKGADAPKSEPVKAEPVKETPKAEPKQEPKAEPAKEAPKAQETEEVIWKPSARLQIGFIFYVRDYETDVQWPVFDRWAAKELDPQYRTKYAWYKDGKYFRDLNRAELKYYFGAKKHS